MSVAPAWQPYRDRITWAFLAVAALAVVALTVVILQQRIMLDRIDHLDEQLIESKADRATIHAELRALGARP